MERGSVDTAVEQQLALPVSSKIPTESEIIQRVLKGEKDEYRHLVVEYKEMIFSLVMRQINDRGTAEDITQDVFTRAFVHLSSFRGDSKFSTWITRIALNCTNTYFTSRNYRERKRSESFDIKRHDIHEGSPIQDDTQNLKLKNFQDALAILKPLHRDVLVLCALEGRSYEDVSTVLRIPVGTVRSRLNKARLLMREHIKELAGGDTRES